MAAINKSDIASDLQMRAVDPNTVDAEELSAMGIPKDIASRWVNFRQHIGKYQSVQDIEKIYGMDSVLLEKLQPFLLFQKEEKDLNSALEPNSDIAQVSVQKIQEVPESKESRKVIKSLDLNNCNSKQLNELGFPERIAQRIVRFREKAGPYYDLNDLLAIYDIDTQKVLSLKERLFIDKADLRKIDINNTSVEELTTLPGIGEVYAKRIIEFRQKSGGFLSLEQLKEVYGIDSTLYERIVKRLTISSPSVKKLKVNELSKEELAAHPYISWKEAQSIMNFRKHNYPITDLSDIIALEEGFIEKITPYIDYGIDQMQGEDLEMR